jgi:hypothetical protein
MIGQAFYKVQVTAMQRCQVCCRLAVLLVHMEELKIGDVISEICSRYNLSAEVIHNRGAGHPSGGSGGAPCTVLWSVLE